MAEIKTLFRLKSNMLTVTKETKTRMNGLLQLWGAKQMSGLQN